ncbi:MAG: cytochrome b/b6 domain-containing protein [Woeseiaceae bacterium]
MKFENVPEKMKRKDSSLSANPIERRRSAPPRQPAGAMGLAQPIFLLKLGANVAAVVFVVAMSLMLLQPPYGLLQKLTYSGVVFVALPLMVITGLTMAPAVTAAHPWLLDLFGGYQSARTVHFFGFALLVLFVIIHLSMVVVTGFRRQLRAMLLGR